MKLFSGKALDAAFASFSEDKEEYRKVFVLFVYLLFVSSASTVGRTAADALFLSQFDSSLLAKMYLPQSAALILVGIIFQKFGFRLRIDRFIFWLIPSLTLLVVISRIGVGMGQIWVLPVIYVMYDVFNFLMIVCFWQFATSILDQRKVKRTIGLVGSGGIVGGIISGFGLKLIVPWTGTANLIFFYAALQLLALAAVFTLVRLSGNPANVFATTSKTTQATSTAKAKKRLEKEKEGLFHSVPHLKYVAIMSAALILALTFVDYQFKVILKGELDNDELAGFMGSFYGLAGLLALAVQVFVAGKLLTRFGVMTAILIFPFVLLTGSFGVLLFPVLAMSVLVKGSDKVVGDTINSSVNQLIMFPIPPQWRNKAKSFLDGIVRNGAKGLAAVCLIMLSPLLEAREFSYVIIGLLILCIAAAIKVKGAYLQTLLAALQTNGAKFEDAELDLIDPASVQLLIGALRSPDKQQVLYAFRVLRGMDRFDLAPHIPYLLRHASHEVVIEALMHIENRHLEGLETELSALLAASDSRVKSQALLALAAYAKEDYLERITDYLEETDMEVKSGAIAGLIKYYGIEGMFRAVGVLKKLLESTDDEERAAVAALFGSIGMKQFYKPLIPLLLDQSPRVRRRALRSAGVLQVPELVGYLVPMLQHGGTRKDAIEALAGYDEKKLIPLLEPFFSREPSPVHLPKVFERIATTSAFDKLLDLYPSSGYEMRNKLLEALSRMLRSVKISEKQTSFIERLIMQDIEFYWKLTEHLTGLSAVERYGEVAEVGGQFRSVVMWRIFQLLALIHDSATIRSVYANWTEGDGRQQANAMEVMDQLTHGPIRIELAKVMEAKNVVMNAARSVTQLKEQLSWLNRQDDLWLHQVIRYAVNPDESDELKEHMDRIRLLRNFTLFQGLTSRELSDMAMKLTQASAKRGEYIFKGNDPGNSLYLIRSGSVGIYRDGVKLGERKAGESFGQSGVLIRRERSADSMAEEDSLLWRLDSDDFYEVMFDRSSIAIEMMKLLSRRLRSVLSEQKASEAYESDHAQENLRNEAAAAEVAAAASSIDGIDRPDSLLRRVLVLQKIDLFAHLAEADIVLLAQMVDEVEYDAGEVVCRVGDYGDALYGIIEGTVRIHRDDVTLAFLGEGDCFGEMAIIDSGPRSADCTATAPTVLFQLHKDQVFSLCFQNIEVLRSMMQVMGDRLKGMAG
ncbi:cyclic nucleotide-binding domain-containing protein [Cohnella sp.]|uniref:cyclic nucleotide-binding domain-containing protein n=1 Tax=Cohnella sp. TaxID=1883426 RepID=UPI00356381C1